MRLRFFIFSFVVIASPFACKTSIKPEKPEESYNPAPTVFEKKISNIAIPIEVSMMDIMKQINSYSEGTLYEDKSYDNNNKDMLKCVVKKFGAIKIDGHGNNLRINVPLDIKGSYMALGVAADFKGVLSATYVTTIKLKDDWKMETSTKYVSHEWYEKPSINMVLFDLPVTTVANAAIVGFQPYIEDQIDGSLKEYVDLKAMTKDIIKGLYEPILVSETYKTWFKMEPLEIFTTQLNATRGVLKLNLGLRGYTETYIGPKPDAVDTSAYPKMKVVTELKDEFNVGIVTMVKYPHATQLMKEQFVDNPYTYTEGKKSITVTQVDLWGQGDKMVIEMGMKGSVNGLIYLIGTPYYDTISRNVKMTNVDFHVDTKSKLLKSANWLMHGKFAKMVEKYCYFELGKQLDESKKECQSFFNSYEVSKGVFLKGKLTTLEADRVYLVDDAIVAVVNAKGNMTVKLEGF